MIIRGSDVSGDRIETADVCVVGSGAGGAVAAKELAESGLSVVILEAGSQHEPTQFNRREADMLPRLFWDGGHESHSGRLDAGLSGAGRGRLHSS